MWLLLFIPVVASAVAALMSPGAADRRRRARERLNGSAASPSRLGPSTYYGDVGEGLASDLPEGTEHVMADVTYRVIGGIWRVVF